MSAVWKPRWLGRNVAFASRLHCEIYHRVYGLIGQMFELIVHPWWDSSGAASPCVCKQVDPGWTDSLLQGLAMTAVDGKLQSVGSSHVYRESSELQVRITRTAVRQDFSIRSRDQDAAAHVSER